MTTATATSTFSLSSLTTTSELPSFTLPTLILTTTFTPPPQCSTQFAQRGRIILNPQFPPIDPAQSTCYESQFMSWYTAFDYEQLVCPQGYQTQSVFATPSNYIACCPENWLGLELWSDAPSTRPAYLASCYTTVPETGLLVTYSESGSLATSTYTPTASGQQAFAFPYDGIAVSVASTTATSTSAPTDNAESGSRSGAAESAVPVSSSGPAENTPTSPAASGANRVVSSGKNGAVIGFVIGASLLFACLLS